MQGEKIRSFSTWMRLRLSTDERSEYCDGWSNNSAHFERQGCYAWMADRLGPLNPQRVLDVGCGTGEGLLALLSAFSPAIASLEENANCIQRSYDAVSAAGFPVETIFRIGYEEFDDGSHEIYCRQDPFVASEQVTLVHADLLVDDPAMQCFLAAMPAVDAVTVWLMGTWMTRGTCRSISNLRIADSNEYRLHIHNRIYPLADRILRPGGWLQVVDRGEPPATRFLQDAVCKTHREMARRTGLEVFDVSYREYKEPTGERIRMVASPSASGRMPDLSTLAMTSVLSRKLPCTGNVRDRPQRSLVRALHRVLRRIKRVC